MNPSSSSVQTQNSLILVLFSSLLSLSVSLSHSLNREGKTCSGFHQVPLHGQLWVYRCLHDPYQPRELTEAISLQKPLKNESHQLSFTRLCKQAPGLFMAIQDLRHSFFLFRSGEHQSTVKTVEYKVNKAISSQTNKIQCAHNSLLV